MAKPPHGVKRALDGSWLDPSAVQPKQREAVCAWYVQHSTKLPRQLSFLYTPAATATEARLSSVIRLASFAGGVQGKPMPKYHRNTRARSESGSAVAPASAIWMGTVKERSQLVVLLLFFAVLAAGGGASHPDVLSVIYIRPVAVLCAGFFIWSGGWHRNQLLPLTALVALAGCIILQLIPLPPTWWMNMPGHTRYAEAAELLGQPQPWRPISIAPDLTLNSLLALLPALTAACAMLSLRQAQQLALPLIMIAIALASAALGVLQVSQGYGYVYAGHSLYVADGIFANRNHQATFLACAIVLLGSWPAMSARTEREFGVRGAVAGCAALFLFLMIVATGSRTGLLLGVLASSLALLGYARGLRPGSWGRRLTSFTPPALLVGLVALMALQGRAASLNRLFGVDLRGEQRFSSLPTLLRMTGEYLPFGSGFGTFDAVFRTAEPENLLHYGYFNHAHNDFIEIVLTGGLSAALLALAFIGWWVRTVWRLFKTSARTPALLLGRSGAAVVTLLGAASLSDYPLRTPLLGAFMVVAVFWMQGGVLPAKDADQARANGRGMRDR